jgi:hemoglobin
VAANDELPIFDMLGEATITAFVHGFYQRVALDPILRPMYPGQDLAGAEGRLREFLIYRFGGPPVYLQKRGHPRLRMRHMPFPIDRRARDRWMELMTAAIAEQGVDDRTAAYLRQFLGDIATFLINQGA